MREIKATGKDGRVLKEDIMSFLGMISKGTTKRLQKIFICVFISFINFLEHKPTGRQAAPTVQTYYLERDKTEPIKGYTRAMVRTMTAANQIPHFGYCDEVLSSKISDKSLSL